MQRQEEKQAKSCVMSQPEVVTTWMLWQQE